MLRVNWMNGARAFGLLVLCVMLSGCCTSGGRSGWHCDCDEVDRCSCGTACQCSPVCTCPSRPANPHAVDPLAAPAEEAAPASPQTPPVPADPKKYDESAPAPPAADEEEATAVEGGRKPLVRRIAGLFVRK